MDTTEHRMREVEEKISRLHTDMYLGEGKENPSMTVRVDRLEQWQEENFANGVATRQMMVATMFTVIGSLVTAFLCYRFGIRI